MVDSGSLRPPSSLSTMSFMKPTEEESASTLSLGEGEEDEFSSLGECPSLPLEHSMLKVSNWRLLRVWVSTVNYYTIWTTRSIIHHLKSFSLIFDNEILSLSIPQPVPSWSMTVPAVQFRVVCRLSVRVPVNVYPCVAFNRLQFQTCPIAGSQTSHVPSA